MSCVHSSQFHTDSVHSHMLIHNGHHNGLHNGLRTPTHAHSQRTLQRTSQRTSQWTPYTHTCSFITDFTTDFTTNFTTDSVHAHMLMHKRATCNLRAASVPKRSSTRMQSTLHLHLHAACFVHSIRLVEECYDAWYQSGSFSLIIVGSVFLLPVFFLFFFFCFSWSRDLNVCLRTRALC
jgi:hypothetical protein